MTKLEGATVYVNATDHLVITFCGVTVFHRATPKEADVFRSLEAWRADEEEKQRGRSKQTTAARDAHRIALCLTATAGGSD